MNRLTRTDWETIQQALTLLDEASENEAHRRKGEDETAFVERVMATRRKVQQRLERAA